jgi:hypothetical protein
MRYSKTKREEARHLFLTGEVPSVAEIARRLKVKAHTVGLWKKEEDWAGLLIKIEKKAAEQLVEKIASERVTLNSSHFKLWGVVVSQLFGALQSQQAMGVADLKEVAGILERAQRGQRLARGLSLDGQTEEQIRAEAEADGRGLIDLFIEVVKAEVPDEEMRDRIARALLERVPAGGDEDEGAA